MPLDTPMWCHPSPETPSISSNSLSIEGKPIHTNPATKLTLGQSMHSTPFLPALSTEFSYLLHALQDKSLDELHQLLTDTRMYTAFLHSLEPIRHLDWLRTEQLMGVLNLASNNLDKNWQLAELRNQCLVIRSELGCANERFDELQKLEREITSECSDASLLDKLKEDTLKVDKESETLDRRLLLQETELGEFVQRYMEERVVYHKRTLVHLAVKSNLNS